MKNRAILVGLVALFTVVSGFAVVPAMPAKGAAEVNTLYLAMQQDIPDFNTYNLGSNSVWKSNVINWGFESLAGLDYNMLPYKLLAEDWEFDPDTLEVTIHLRHGVYFHDQPDFGYAKEEMDADDVVFCYRAARDGTTYSSNLINAFDSNDDAVVSWAEINAGVWKVDKYTVKMKMAKPYGAFFTNTLGLPIMPESIWNQTGRVNKDPASESYLTFNVLWNHELATVSTGPYKYKEGLPGIYRVMVRNEDYWGKDFTTPAGYKIFPPNVHRLYYKIYASIDTAILALQAGDVDHITWAITAGRVPSLQVNPNIRMQYLADNGYFYLAFNQKMQPMNLLKYRQAISHLIDKEQIVNVYMGGFGSMGTAVEPPFWGAWHNESVKAYPYDDPFDDTSTIPEDLLDEAGLTVGPDGWRRLPDGSPMEKIIILTPPADYDPIRIRAGQAIAKNMREVGINAEAKAIDFDTLVARMTSMDFQMLIIGWSLSSDPIGNVFDILGPKASSNTFGFWAEDDPNPFYKDLLGVNTLADAETQELAKEVDRLGQLAMQNFSIESQIFYTRWAQGVIADAVPVNVLYYRVSILAYTTRWTGWIPFLGDIFGPGSNIYSLANLQLSGAAGPAGGATQTVNLGISLPNNVGKGKTVSGHVIAIDNLGSPVSGATVTLSSASVAGGASTVTVAPASGTTDANGVLAFTVTGTGSGYSYINASTTVGSVTSTDSTTILSSPEMPETLYLSVKPAKQVLRPDETTLVDLYVKDEAGANVQGANITIDPNLIGYGSMQGGVSYVLTDASGHATMTYVAPATITDLNTHLTTQLSFQVSKDGYGWTNAAAANLLIYNEAAPNWVMARVNTVSTTALSNTGNVSTITIEAVDDSGAALANHRMTVSYSDASKVVAPTTVVTTNAGGIATLTVQMKNMAASGALKVTIANTSVLNSVAASVTLTFVGSTPPAAELYGGYMTFAEPAQYIHPLGSVDVTAHVWDSAGAPVDGVMAALIVGATPYGTLTWSDDINWDSTWDGIGISIVTSEDKGNYVTSGPLNTPFDEDNYWEWYYDAGGWLWWEWGDMTGVEITGGEFTTTVYGVDVTHLDQVGGIWLVPDVVGFFNETSSAYQIDGTTSIVSEYVIGRSYQVVTATYDIVDPVLIAKLTDYETTAVNGVVRDEDNNPVEGAGLLVYENSLLGNRQYGVTPSTSVNQRWSLPAPTDADGEATATIRAVGLNLVVTPASIRADVYVKAVLDGAVGMFAQTQIFIFVQRTFSTISAVPEVQEIGSWGLNVSAKVVNFAGQPVANLGVDMTADLGSVYSATPKTNETGWAWFTIDTYAEGVKAAFLTLQFKAAGPGWELSLAKMKVPMRNLAPTIAATMSVGETGTAVLSGGEVEEGQTVALSLMVFDANNLKSVRVVVDGETTNLPIVSGEVPTRDYSNPVDALKYYTTELSDLERGTHTVVVNATDAFGVSSEQTFTFEVVKAKGGDTLMLTLAIVGWVVAAIVIVLLLMKMRKPKPAAEAPAEAAPPEEPKPPETQ